MAGYEEAKEKLDRAALLRSPLRNPCADAAVREDIQQQRRELQQSIRPLATPNGVIKSLKTLRGEEKSRVFGEAPEVHLSPAELIVPDEDDGLTPDSRALLRRREAAEARNRLIYDPHLTFEDLMPYRIRVAWRLVREMARARTMLQPDESLAEALEPWEGNVDPWLQPEPWEMPRNINAFGPIPKRLVEAILQSEELPADMCYSRMNTDWSEGQPDRLYFTGVALLPPPVPFCMRDDDGHPDADYDPEYDPALMQYVALLRSCSEGLNVWQGSKLDRDEGRYGMQGLLDPMTCRLCFPSRLELMVWEQIIVEETLTRMVSVGTPQTIALLRDRYGLLRREAVGLVKMARVQATVGADADAEEDRAVMILRLEDVIGRSRDAIDLRAEMQALKQLCIVQGLGRTDPNDAMTDFIAIAQAVTDERDRKGAIAAQEQAFLPPAEPVDGLP